MINVRSAIVIHCKQQKHPFFSQIFLKINNTEIIYLFIVAVLETCTPIDLKKKKKNN